MPRRTQETSIHADLRFVSTRTRIFPQRTASAPNYHVARFQKRENNHNRAELSSTADLRSKLLHARSTIFRLS